VHICKNEECLLKAFKTKRLEKNLEAKLEEEVYNKLKEEIKSAG
jgi:predicted RNA-binding protein YlxR (DUF448 family)